MAILLLIVYLGRLILLDPANLVRSVLALLAGLVVRPIWCLWLVFCCGVGARWNLKAAMMEAESWLIMSL